MPLLRSAAATSAGPASTSWTRRARSTSWTFSAQSPATTSTSWTREASTSWTRQASTSWTRRATVAVAGTLASLCAFGPGVASAATLDQSGPTSQYVVRAVPGQLSALHRDLGRTGTVVREIGLINADVVALTSAQAARLAHDPRVVSVSPNSRVHLAGVKQDRKHAAGQSAASSQDSTGDQSNDGSQDTRKSGIATMADVASDIGADDLHDAGTTGKGIDVALIDSGVAPLAGLTGGKVVLGPDLSFDSQDPDTRYVDGYGHGTHLAGIIAGRTEGLTGIAPDARIVSVKVADRMGSADVSQVIAGIDWVVRHAHTDGLNVRVLNLSFGTDSKQAYQIDPLAYAAEQAWHAGIVVVASVGNDGTSKGRVSDPAIDPFVLAVGAADTTLEATKVASFSGRGDGVRNPDLVAPGAHVASLQPHGTFASKLGGSRARLDNGQFLGSGTSQAAAVVSGAAALLLSDRPDLSPDQVKALLTSTADRLASGKRRSQGHGMIDVAAAADAPATDAQQGFARANGTGSLDASRGSRPVYLGDSRLSGEIDIFGRPWAGPATDFSQWSSEALASTNWGAVAWGTTNWAAVAWGTTNWGSTNWSSSNWGSTNWSSSNWAGSNWAGTNWG